MQLLRQSEINGMKSDFVKLLDSPEASNILLIWDSIHTGTWNATYENYENDTITISSLLTRAICPVIRATYLEKLSEGKMKEEVKAFAIDPKIDIEKENFKIQLGTIYDPNGEFWYPIVPRPSFADSMETRIGDEYVYRIIIARRGK